MKKKSRARYINLGFVMALVVMAFLAFSEVVPGAVAKAGYGSWIRGKESGPSAGTVTPLSNGNPTFGSGGELPDPDEEKGDSWEVRISTAIVHAALYVSKSMKSQHIDASVTGVVMAHLTNGTGTSNFVFDLTDTNIYGIVGATIYAALRTLVLGFLFIYVLIRLIITLYEGDIHGLANMKEIIYSAVLTMILMFIMPQIVDWGCTARDSIASFMYTRVNDITNDLASKSPEDAMLGVQGLEVPYYTVWADNRSFMNAVIFFMVVVIVPVVYVFSYVKIAIQQVMLFGMYPVFSLLGFGDKSLNGKWAIHFFSNAFVPAIDMTLMFIPAIVSAKMAEAGLPDGFLKAIIVVACFVSVVPVRNQILAMLGNSFGVSPNIAGAMALGAAAIGGVASIAGGLAAAGARGAGSLIGGLGSDKRSESVEQAQESSQSMADAVKDFKDVSGSAKEEEAANKKSGMDEHGITDIPSRSESESKSFEKENSEKEAMDILNGKDNTQTPETVEERSQAEQNAELANEMLRDNRDLTGLSESKEGGNGGTGGGAPEVPTGGGAPEVPIEPITVEAPEQPYEPAAGDEISADENLMIGDISPSVREDVPVDTSAFSYHAVTSGDVKSTAEEVKGKELEKKDSPEYRAQKVMEASANMDKRSGTGNKYSEFNAARLANLENISNLNDQNRQLSDSIHSEHKYQAATVKQMKDIDNKINSLSSGKVGEKESQEIRSLSDQRYQLREQLKDSESKVKQYGIQQKLNEEDLNKFNRLEKGFASAAADAKMESKIYTSASDFAKDMERADKIRNIADYKNFKADEVRGYLTPEQRNQFEKREQLHNVGRAFGGAIGTAVGKGVGIAVGGAAAAAIVGLSSVGGESAMDFAAKSIGTNLVRRGGGSGGSVGDYMGGAAGSATFGAYGSAKDGVKGYINDGYMDVGEGIVENPRSIKK